MILVVGSTGMLGGLITHRLLEQGRDVRILVRPTSDHAALVQAGAKPVVGDLKDPASLRAAVEGVETVITTANSARRGGEDNVQTVDLDGNAALIDAAREAGIDHFIFTSALGSLPDSPIPFVAAKGKTEQRLRESGMTFTILAPTPYMEVWLGMVVFGPMLEGRDVSYIGDGTQRHSMVAVGDVASFAVAAVDHPEARNAYIPIAGRRPSHGATRLRPSSARPDGSSRIANWRRASAYPVCQTARRDSPRSSARARSR